MAETVGKMNVEVSIVPIPSESEREIDCLRTRLDASERDVRELVDLLRQGRDLVTEYESHNAKLREACQAVHELFMRETGSTQHERLMLVVKVRNVLAETEAT